MVQVRFRVPTPLAVRKGLFSCWLQELCLQGSQCLLSCTGILALPGARDCLAAARELALHACVCDDSVVGKNGESVL